MCRSRGCDQAGNNQWACTRTTFESFLLYLSGRGYTAGLRRAMSKAHLCHFHQQHRKVSHLPCSRYRRINSIENFSLRQFLQPQVRNGNLFNEDDCRSIERASERSEVNAFLPNLTRKGCLVTGLIKLLEVFTSSSASPAMISAWLRPNGFFISSSSSSAIDLLYAVDWLCWGQKKIELKVSLHTTLSVLHRSIPDVVFVMYALEYQRPPCRMNQL